MLEITDQKISENGQFLQSVSLSRTAEYIVTAYLITKFTKLNFNLTREHRGKYFYHKLRKFCLFFLLSLYLLKKKAFQRQLLRDFQRNKALKNLKSQKSTCETSNFSVMLEIRQVFLLQNTEYYRIPLY